jgi:hypothetical protein
VRKGLLVGEPEEAESNKVRRGMLHDQIATGMMARMGRFPF